MAENKTTYHFGAADVFTPHFGVTMARPANAFITESAKDDAALEQAIEKARGQNTPGFSPSLADAIAKAQARG
jgi:hypothetical protein